MALRNAFAALALDSTLTGGTGKFSLGTSAGKTVVMKTGSLVTTATTADQVILTYTVTAGKTFYLQYLEISGRTTAIPGNTNPVQCGLVSLENPSGTKLYTEDITGSTGAALRDLILPEPIPIAAGTVIRVVCTPASVTSFTWRANFGGYER